MVQIQRFGGSALRCVGGWAIRRPMEPRSAPSASVQPHRLAAESL